MKKIILASQSPRRKQLIQALGVPVVIQTADFDESTVSDPDPAQDAIVTSLGKAQAVAQLQDSPAIIIGSDTNVALGDLILGKPADSAEAIRTLKLLRNKPHQVHTGIALINQYTGETFTDVATIQVTMRNYTDAEIEAYVASGCPMDKAGSYAIQNPEFHPVADSTGCYSGIVGLPVCLLGDALHAMGVPVRESAVTLCKQHHYYEPNVLELLLTIA